MAQREEQADADRPLALLHELARDVVDRRDMIGVDRVPKAKSVGEQSRAHQDRPIAKGGKRPDPHENIAADQDGVDGDQSAAQISAALIQDIRDDSRHGALACCSRKTARSRGCAPKIQTIGSPRPEIGCTSDGRSPGSRVNDGRRSSRFPSDHEWRRLSAHSCGGSHGIGLSACTVFPFDPRREPSPRSLEMSPVERKSSRRSRRAGVPWPATSGEGSRPVC